MSNYSFNIFMESNKKFSRNKSEKINLIYETFFYLIQKMGYNKTSTNHVAKKANISIGTIYRYFPKGKKDIIRKYLENEMETFIETQNLSNINDDNIRDFLNHFVTDLFNRHKENRGFNMAFRSAIQSDKTLHVSYENRIFSIFENLAQDLRKKNENFEIIPEKKLVDVFVFIYNLVNAVLYHHLTVMKLYEDENKLIEFLSNIVAFSLKYYLEV